jgi:hypothetical protein
MPQAPKSNTEVFMRYCLLLLLLICVGCSPIEFGKTIWGSSTRALENARADAIKKTYDFGYWESMRAALKAIEKQGYLIFKKDEIRGYIVVMHVKGNVNTTEVGIFFEELSESQVRIEISSLSTSAKRTVAKNLFHNMDITFGLIPPDPIEEKPKDDETSKK